MVFDLFSVIHEFAVLGTTFFIMALATLWYSSLAFGETWARVSGVSSAIFDESSTDFIKQLVVAFFAYGIQITLLAWLIALVSTVGMTPMWAAVLLSIFVLAATAAPVVYETKVWQYYAIHSGFMVLSIVVSVASLTYWPW
jgi:Protein of unknown function (DUF1761)